MIDVISKFQSGYTLYITEKFDRQYFDIVSDVCTCQNDEQITDINLVMPHVNWDLLSNVKNKNKR